MQLAGLGAPSAWSVKGIAGMIGTSKDRQEPRDTASPGGPPTTGLQNDVRLIGFGGAGRNFIETYCQGLGWTLIAADRDDEDPVSAALAYERIDLTYGYMPMGREMIDRTLTKRDTDKFYPTLEGADVVIVVGALGGRTGWRYGSVAAGIARRLGAFTVGIGITPFEFEGPKRYVRAQEALAVLRRNADVTIEISNQKQAEILWPRDWEIEDAWMQGERSVAEFLARTFPHSRRPRPLEVAATTPNHPA